MTAPNPFIEHEAKHQVHPYLGGDQWTFLFANGYGASVIQNSMSYGGGQGLYEVAVLGPDGHLTYSTPITNDVLGHQSVEDVREVLRSVAELPVASAVSS